MKVGIVSYYNYDDYIEPSINASKNIYENWNKAWVEVFKLSKENNITLEKYNQKEHNFYDKILIIEIPRIQDLFQILYSNIFLKKIRTILLINETFIGRARYMLRIPFLFDSVFINSELNLVKYLSYKVKTFSYPTIPSKNTIIQNRENILNNKRKNKIVFIGSFKLALNKYGSYIHRYKIIKGLTKYPGKFALYGFNWEKKQIPFDLFGIAIIKRIKLLEKFLQNIFCLYFAPLGKFSLANNKLETLRKYQFSLVFEPTTGKFNSICEKIFDPMLSGTIPIYYGQPNLIDIPPDTYIRIEKTVTPLDIVEIVKRISQERIKNYRDNIYKFLISKSANKYRFETFAQFIVDIIKR